MPFTVSDLFLGPLIAFGLVGLLALVLRWALGRGSSQSAWPVPPQPDSASTQDDYGLLRTVAVTDDPGVALLIRTRLAAAGIRATVATGADGRYRVLVFAERFEAARRLVS